MRSRHASTAPAKRSPSSSASEATCCGALTITSCAPFAADAAKRSGSPARVGAPSGSAGLAKPDSGGPARGVRLPTAGAHRVDLGRGAVLAHLAERAVATIRARGFGVDRERVRALGPARRQHRALAGELVD